MKVTLDDGRIVRFRFTLERHRRGNHSTVCLLRVFKSDDTLERSTTGTAKCDERDVYDKATGKAKSLARALGKMELFRARRANRKKVWETFYKTLQTRDVAFLSGCEKYM